MCVGVVSLLDGAMYVEGGARRMCMYCTVVVVVIVVVVVEQLFFTTMNRCNVLSRSRP